MVKNVDRSFYRFATIHACDRQTDRRTDGRTDRQTEFSSLDRVCISMQRGKNYEVLSKSNKLIIFYC